MSESFLPVIRGARRARALIALEDTSIMSWLDDIDVRLPPLASLRVTGGRGMETDR